MPKKTVQLPKEVTRQLGLRANKADEMLITKAAQLSKRDRNSFILVAALDESRRILQAHGIEEDPSEIEIGVASSKGRGAKLA